MKMFNQNSQPTDVEFSMVETIRFERRDLFTIDQAAFEVTLADGKVFVVTEDQEGYHAFIEWLDTHIPGHADVWQTHLYGPGMSFPSTPIYSRASGLIGPGVD